MPVVPATTRATTGNQRLAAQGIAGETYPALVVAGTATFTSQAALGYMLQLEAGQAVRGVMLRMTIAASGTAPTLARFGLADSTGKILILSGDVGAAANWPIGMCLFPFTATYVVPATAGYYVCWVINGTWSVTQPSALRQTASAAINNALTGYPPASFTWATQTDLPAIGSSVTLTTQPASGTYAAAYL